MIKLGMSLAALIAEIENDPVRRLPIEKTFYFKGAHSLCNLRILDDLDDEWWHVQCQCKCKTGKVRTVILHHLLRITREHTFDHHECACGYRFRPKLEDIEEFEFSTYASDEPNDPSYEKTSIPIDLRWAVWERDNFTCKHCGLRRRLSIDHIVPESKGGVLTMDNLQTLCVSCNAKKGTKAAL